MALMDIPDLTATVHTVARIVEPNGWFIFSILHPCYNTPPSGELATPDGWVRTVSRYFTEGYWRSEARTGPPGKVGCAGRFGHPPLLCCPCRTPERGDQALAARGPGCGQRSAGRPASDPFPLLERTDEQCGQHKSVPQHNIIRRGKESFMFVE